MEQTQKIEKGKKVSSRRFWKILFVFAVAFFVFGVRNDASATVECSSSSAKYKCTVVTRSGSSAETCSETGQTDCESWCKTYNQSTACNSESYNAATGETTGNKTGNATNGDGTSVLDWVKDPLGMTFKTILYGIFKFFVWLLGAATALFAWVVDGDRLSILDNEGIYQSWAMVRDFLNLGFILVLLYIAFCVIFQIGSYSDGWKKMLLMMVIMALLVNFSFPICRVIIDFSNVAFYYLLNVGFPDTNGDSIFTRFADYSGFGKLLSPKNLGSTNIAYLIAIIVFTFILALTFLVIAVLFVVRLVALGLLIIFSPIGIAGAAFPFSKKYASQWWDNLFKYSFFAPIMIFMILIANNILHSLKINKTADEIINKASNNAGTSDVVDAGFIGDMAFFAIPIVILWFGMHYANELSIAGSKAVTGTADKFAKWAGRQPWRGVKAGWRATGVPGGFKSGMDKFSKTGKLFGAKIPLAGSEAREGREAMLAGGLAGGRQGMNKARRDLDQKRINEKVKEMEDTNVSHAQVMSDLNPASAGYGKLSDLDRKAYAKYLIKKDSIGRLKDANELKNVLSASGNDAELMKDVIGKVKKANNRKLLIDFEMNHGEIDEKADVATDVVKAASRKTANDAHKAWLDGLNAESFSKERGLDPRGASGTDLRNYILSNIATNPARHQKIYGELSVGSQTNWDAAGLTP